MAIWIKFPSPVHFHSWIPKVLMLTLTASCLTMSNLPWFVDLTFQVPVQYCSYSIRNLMPSSVTSTTGHCFLFGSASSFFLELFLCSSPVAYWTTFNLGALSSGVMPFCLFILFIGFSWQEFWSGELSLPPVDQVLSDLSTWPIFLAWPCEAWLIASLNYPRPFTTTRLWSMKGKTNFRCHLIVFRW